MTLASAWPWLLREPLILASGSATRATILRGAGLSVETDRPATDERALEAPMRAAGLVAVDRALALARAKALEVSRRRPGRLVLGADQTLDAAGHSGAKASSIAEARAQLRTLSGRTHRLHAAAVVARDGLALLECVETAAATVRTLDEPFIDAYLDRMGDDVLQSVGGYRLEELGRHLFSDVDGDHAVILGLPLTSIFRFLRCIGALA
jgi:septum formation protein